MPTHRIFIVDDKDYLRDLLTQLVESWPGFSVCGTAASVTEALVRLPEAAPDLALVDINLGKGPTGLDLIRTLHTAHPHIRFVMLTGNDNNAFRDEATLAGAAAYVLKNQVDELESILRHTLASGDHESPASTDDAVDNASDLPRPL